MKGKEEALSVTQRILLIDLFESLLSNVPFTHTSGVKKISHYLTSVSKRVICPLQPCNGVVSKSQQIEASPDIIYRILAVDSANAKLPVLTSASLFVELFFILFHVLCF